MLALLPPALLPSQHALHHTPRLGTHPFAPPPPAPAPLQLSHGLLAATDRREGVTLYRYHEPPPASQGPLAPQQRARLARRYRLAPPGAGELRHRLGLVAQQHAREGGGVHGAAASGKPPEEEEEGEVEPGFGVVAADSCCRPAVGALVLPAAADPAAASGSGARSAAAAAVLDACGELRLLQQRWPGHEPALRQRCRFLLREPAAALLPGSLGYQADAASAGVPFGATAATTAAAAAAVGEAVAVTLGGAVLSLLPLEQADAAQLVALQRALATHPAAAPLSGGSHAAYRGWDAGGRQGVPLAFEHPPPAGAKEGGPAADALAPASPGMAAAGAAAAAGAQEGSLAREPAPLALEPAAPEALAEAPPAAGSGSEDAAESAGAAWSGSPHARAAAAEAAAPMDAILDAELLQEFLLLPPAEQRALVAGMGAAGAGGGLAVPDLRRAAQRLSNLVASLLL